MTITTIGFFIIITGILLYFIDVKKLYYFTVFCIPFTATSVMLTSSYNSISACHFLIMLLIFNEFNYIFKNLAIRLPKNKYQLKSLKLIFIFLVVVISTLIMPIIIDGDLRVHTGETDNYLYGGDFKLEFSFSLILRLFPIILGLIFTYLLIININKKYDLLKIITVFSFSIFFVSLWGFFQIFAFYSGLNFPDYIFNTMSTDFMMESNTVFGNYYSNFPRINSVTQEPSHLSLNLLSAIPILYSILLLKSNSMKFNLYKIGFFGSIILLALTTSTTAFLGLIILFFVSIYIIQKFEIFSVKRFLYSGILILFVVITLYFNVEIIQSFINQVLIDKGDSSSALVRLFTISESFEYFKKYPILGIGWSVATSDDLFVLFLANSGLIGLFSFLFLIYYVIKSSIYLYKSNNLEVNFKNSFLIINISFLISLITFILVSVFLGFLWYQPLFYFIVGILVANFKNYKIKIDDI